MQIIPPAQLSQLADMICERIAPIMVDLAGTAARNPPPMAQAPDALAKARLRKPTHKRATRSKVQNF